VPYSSEWIGGACSWWLNRLCSISTETLGNVQWEWEEDLVLRQKKQWSNICGTLKVQHSRLYGKAHTRALNSVGPIQLKLVLFKAGEFIISISFLSDFPLFLHDNDSN